MSPIGNTHSETKSGHRVSLSRSCAPPGAPRGTPVLFSSYTCFHNSHAILEGNPPGGERAERPGLTLFMYSLSRSCSACRTALHSATIRSRRSSRVHEESAMSAAPLMMLSSLSSSDGRNRASLNVMGSRMILFCRDDSKVMSRAEDAACAP